MLNRILDKACDQFPLKTGLVFEGRHYTYAELSNLTYQLATSLIKRDIKVGDRVAFLLPNCLEIVLCYYACFRIGAIAVPLNIHFSPEVINYVINHSEARILISEPGLFAGIEKIRSSLPKVEQYYLTRHHTNFDGVMNFNDLLKNEPTIDNRLVSEADIAAIFYTSGTTGKPKGVIHTHYSLEQATNNQIKQIGISDQDSTLIMFPICYLIGFGSQVLSFHYCGAICILLPHFEPKLVLEAIQIYEPRKIYGFPKLYNDLVNHPDAEQYNLRSLNFCFSAGEAIPIAIQQQFKHSFGIEITEGCGMTELQIYSMNPPYGDKKIGSIGQPIYGMQVALIDDRGNQVSKPNETGEMIVRGGSMTVGYWSNQELTLETIRDGWFHTGDLAYQDEDDVYWFVSRKSEIIQHQDKLVSSVEVEGVLYQHPSVREVGVIGVPDKTTGEVVEAHVVLKTGYKSITEQVLIDFAKLHLAAYKLPQKIVFTDHLLYGATGKIDRKTLRENTLCKRQK